MSMIIDNWYIILAAWAVGFFIGTCIYRFITMPSDKKIMCLKEWLYYAVVEAEKKFQDGTGQLKLHYVYDLAIEKFKWIPMVLSFNEFSEYVDEALVWMRTQLEFNQNVKAYVKGGGE